MPEIRLFLKDKDELKRLLLLTKQTDSFYLTKRNITKEYNPLGAYDFTSWKHCLDGNVCREYENLHKTLLFTDTKQNFSEAIAVLEEINIIFASINE